MYNKSKPLIRLSQILCYVGMMRDSIPSFLNFATLLGGGYRDYLAFCGRIGDFPDYIQNEGRGFDFCLEFGLPVFVGLCFFAITWGIWLERNATIFQSSVPLHLLWGHVISRLTFKRR